MVTRRKAVVPTTGATSRFDGGDYVSADRVQIGQWYWVKETASCGDRWDDAAEGDEVEWLGCVMSVGSNYIELHSPHTPGQGYNTRRVHYDDYDDVLRHEPNAAAVIARKISHFQTRVDDLLDEVRRTTARLGVSSAPQLEQSVDTTNALVVLSAQTDTAAYKNALIEAKETTLPALFRSIEDANKELARWMTATAMTTLAEIGPMKESVARVGERIYTLELYAGLTETAVEVKGGAPAALNEKLRVMQRRLYMDEECLANYEAGGMEMEDISQFDEWLCRDENRDRILPFERCVVAFRVRRRKKDRDDPSTLWQAWVNINLAAADKKTFLYVRNGEQLWRINCDFDFGSRIVPDRNEFDPSQPMMIKLFGKKVDGMIPLSAWEVMRDEELEKQRLSAEWEAANPEENWIRNPYRNTTSQHLNYHPFDPSSVYYDDALKKMNQEIKSYNRIAIILQGLFDRSPVLHPHPPVRVGDPASFAQSIEVVYDATTLTSGDKPDFEAYRAELNESLREGAMVTGQEDYWLRREADRENKRQYKDYRQHNRQHHTRYRPYGNPGPGLVAPLAAWKPRARKAVFRWTRARLGGYDYCDRGEIECGVTVPSAELLNVSAYRPGDYKRFFSDPRTRAEYLQWAPLLLAAEDYHANGTKEHPGY